MLGLLWFFLCFVGCVLFFKKQIVCGMGLSFDFFVFYYFFLRLGNSLQKNNLFNFKLVLIQFGYRRCSFLSHAVSLRFMVFS